MYDIRGVCASLNDFAALLLLLLLPLSLSLLLVMTRGGGGLARARTRTHVRRRDTRVLTINYEASTHSRSQLREAPSHLKHTGTHYVINGSAERRPRERETTLILAEIVKTRMRGH
jgi:hypothetical protein